MAETVGRFLHQVHILLHAHIQTHSAGPGIKILLHILETVDPSARQDGRIHRPCRLLDQADHRLVVLIRL